MCAIFGVLDYEGNLTATQRLRMVKSLSIAAEIRGTDATGIAYFQRDKLCIQKAPKPAHKMRYHSKMQKGYLLAIGDGYIENAVHIERNDELCEYPDDRTAAKAAEHDGIKLIYGMKGVQDGVYLDTPENRITIQRSLATKMSH